MREKLLVARGAEPSLCKGNEKERQPTPDLKTNSIKSLTVQANSYKSAKTIIMTVAKAV